MADDMAWPLVVAAVVFVPEAVQLVANALQRSWIGRPLAPELDGIYDAKEYETSNRYTRAKMNFGDVHTVFDLALFFGFWFLRGFPLLDKYCTDLDLGSDELTGLAFIAIVYGANTVLGLPWSWYSTFVIEESFGFNKTTPWTFVKDRVKGLVLTIVLGGPLAFGVLYVLRVAGPNAWLYAYLAVYAVQVIMLFLAPVLLLPIFLEMIDLPSGTALVTNEAPKESSIPAFLSCRVLYMRDADYAGQPCWITKDRRFQGAAKGKILSVSWSRGEGAWVLGEGAPDTAEGDAESMTIYATTTADPASGGLDGIDWSLKEAALAAPKETPADSEKKLLEELSICTTCADVGSLRSRLLALANQLGYIGAKIFVIDGSSRSSHSNAFCTGFGRFRRICLFDTMLPILTEGEIVAVLGHEIGHDRLYHVHKMVLIGMLEGFLTFYAVGLFLHSEAISSAFFVDTPKVYLGLILFSILWGVVSFVTGIPNTIFSRMNEFAADRYSIEANPAHAKMLGDALIKMMRKSKANLTPHPFFVFLNHSHPPLHTRLKAIDAHQKITYPA